MGRVICGGVFGASRKKHQPHYYPPRQFPLIHIFIKWNSKAESNNQKPYNIFTTKLLFNFIYNIPACGTRVENVIFYEWQNSNHRRSRLGITPNFYSSFMVLECVFVVNQPESIQKAVPWLNEDHSYQSHHQTGRQLLATGKRPRLPDLHPDKGVPDW